MSGPTAHLISSGRLHLNHGPIDLIIKAWGKEKRIAFQRAQARFETVLQELMDEIDLLRTPISQEQPLGKIALEMWRATHTHPRVFVTPMASVAGAVADEICRVMCNDLEIEKAYVNNGGDISVHLSRDQTLVCAIPDVGRVSLSSNQNVRGIATSGWQGRSQSLGIADSVTVLAKTAAGADVAATLIANAVSLGNHDAIRQQPANTLAPDSDLGDRLVTVSVGALTPTEIEMALTAGRACARRMVDDGVILSAALSLRGHTKIVGNKLPETLINPTGETHARFHIA